MALRPARLLPPKRLLTPRLARHLSTTDRGLLPGSPAITRTGLTPAGLIQLSGRTMGPTLAAAADTCVAQAANRRRAPNTRSSLSWPVEVLLARLRGLGIGRCGR